MLRNPKRFLTFLAIDFSEPKSDVLEFKDLYESDNDAECIPDRMEEDRDTAEQYNSDSSNAELPVKGGNHVCVLGSDFPFSNSNC